MTEPCRHDLEAHARQHEMGLFERIVVYGLLVAWPFALLVVLS